MRASTQSSQRRSKPPPIEAGIAVDAYGGATEDPTKNVRELVEAEVRRLDNMADLREQLATAKHECVREGLEHVKEIATLRAAHAETTRNSDLDRLAQTRQVDVLAGTASAAQLATAVQTLATTSDRNAETLRNQLNADRAALAKQVSDTASSLSTQTDSLMKDVNNRIAELQKASYTGAGRSTVADPQMEMLMAEVRKMSSAVSVGSGKSEGLSMGAAILIGAVSIIGGLVGIGGVLFAVLKP